MANFNFVTAGGGKIKLAARDSIRLGDALEAKDAIFVGTIFKPADGAERDALVAWLQGLDYSAKTYQIDLEYQVPNEGLYRVSARRQDTQDELDTWVKEERKAMAKRLGLKDSADITLTITEV